MKKASKLKDKLVLKLSLLVLCIFLALLGTLVFSNRYTASMVRQNTLELNQKILVQAQNKLEDFWDHIYNVAASFSYSPTTKQYLSQDILSRVQGLDNLSTVFSNVLLLEEDIKGIYLYNKDLERIASLGKEFAVPDFPNDLVSDMKVGTRFRSESSNHLYYPVYFPIYDLDTPQYQKQLGMCILVLAPDSLKALLTDAKSTDHTQVFLLDQNNGILVQEGSPAQTFTDDMLTSSDEYYVQIQDSSSSGWRIVCRLPESELNRQDAGTSLIVLLAYGAAFLLLIVLICFSYFHIIRPLHSIDLFIRSNPTQPGKRLDLNRSDEIGTVAASLNHMLDETARMNEEIRLSQKRAYETELVKKQAQVLAYRSQINPHFLYNTFECIRDMALFYEVEDIAEITMALSQLFRYAVKGKSIVTIGEEMDNIQEYAKIIDYRFMGKISVDTEVDEIIRDQLMPKLLLQPLVENAVFHGLEQKVAEGLVDICVSQADTGYMRISIEDNGCGIPEEELNRLRLTMEHHKNKEHIGISNIYQRLKLFYEDRFTFTITSTPGVGTCITILIPDTIEEGSDIFDQGISS